jgi:hypothetical protein
MKQYMLVRMICPRPLEELEKAIPFVNTTIHSRENKENYLDLFI